jgi:alpha-L-fucosidase
MTDKKVNVNALIDSKKNVVDITTYVTKSKLESKTKTQIHDPKKLQNMVDDMEERGVTNIYSLMNIVKTQDGEITEENKKKLNDLINTLESRKNNAKQHKEAEQYVQDCLKKYDIAKNDYQTLAKLYMAKLNGYEKDDSVLRGLKLKQVVATSTK